MRAPAADPMLLFCLVLLPFLLAVCAMLPGVRTANRATMLAGAAMLGGCALLGVATPAVLDGETLRSSVPWFAGVNFGFRMDGLAFAFALLVCGIGALVVLYARYYLDANDSHARFFSFLLAFQGSMLGVVLADNLILLVAFWELTGITSFLLIGFRRQRADARQGARMALAVTGAGGLCLLAGAILIGHIVGSYDLDRVLGAGDAIRADPWYVPALVLVLLGAFTKSAQLPFSFWLPQAMAAPTPASAYLHSATMVKAGVFLLARLYPALGHSEPWFFIVGGVGLATMLFGAVAALFQQDLKGLLAYSTVSQLGLITLLFGLDSPLAVVAGMFHILNHAAFKASLFMAAGILDHETGTRDLRRLNGLWRYMPWTAALATVASGAMAGVPLLNGFLSKEMFFAETLEIESHRIVEYMVPIGASLAAAFSVAYSVRFVYDVFFNGNPVGLDRTPHEPPRWMRVPVEALVFVCLAVGILPDRTVGPLLAIAARAVQGGPLPPYSLAIWHGVTPPLLMSLVATAIGAATYFGLHRAVNLHTLSHLPTPARDAFETTMRAVQGLSDLAVRALPFGRLPPMLTWFVLATLIAAALPVARGGFGAWATPVAPTGAPGAATAALGCAVWLLGVAGAVAATIRYRQRFLALVFLGVTGLAVSLAFVLLSAPDLALTQLLVEVVTIVLMLLVLHYLPQTAPPEPGRWRRWRDALIAGAAGIAIALAAYTVLTRTADSIAPYYLAHAVPAGGGANAVNVIIVDFRGLDTMGEIAVLAIGGLIVHALLAGVRVPAGYPAGRPPAMWNPMLVQVATRMLLPLAALTSVYLFLRGHNLPGGGFIAGLVLAAAIVVTRIAGGAPLPDAGRLDHPAWIGAGLLVAGLTGVGSWAFGYPFLTSAHGHPHVALLGEVPLATAGLFDLGVFLTVVGATTLLLIVPGLLTRPARAQPERGR